MKKYDLFVLAFLAIFTITAIVVFSSAAARAKTITVDNSGGQQHMTIQDAVNASGDGDTIYVYNGVYRESITINKTINLIGESSQGVIIQGEGFVEGIRIIADNANVSNLRVDNFSYGIYIKGQNNTVAHNIVTLAYQYGILLDSASNNTIEDNTITDSDQGIRLEYSAYNTVNANSVANNPFGIVLYYSTQNNITSNVAANTAIIITGDNTVSNNTINGKPLLYFKNINATASPQTLDNVAANGIILYNCSGFKITNTSIAYGGIILENSSRIEIASNTITNSAAGIYMSYGTDNVIVSNTIITDGGIGIDLDPGLNNTIARNNITNCSYGIYLHFSTGNNITANNIYANSECGLYSEASTNNTAVKNWWGAVSGPYHQTKNPSGKGDNISGDILFSPWLAAQFNGTMPQTNQTNTNQTQNETTPATTEKKESKGFIPGFEVHMLANIVCLWILLTRKRRK
jgi:parallel beta-helix repeat protein